MDKWAKRYVYMESQVRNIESAESGYRLDDTKLKDVVDHIFPSVRGAMVSATQTRMTPASIIALVNVYPGRH
jgi:hypothetical protein